MNEKTLKALEYKKIVEQVKDMSQTSIGKRLAEEMFPETHFERVQHMQNETDEAVQILRLNQMVPLGGVTDISAALRRSEIGSVLSVNECLSVGTTIYGGRMAKRFLTENEEINLLKHYGEQITPLYEVERSINQAIDEQGDVRDTASQKLSGIRASIRDIESRIRERLQNYMRSKRKMLSDSIVTIRNDRYVLPVKSEYRSAIGGIVHDQSSSGQTLFMEPQAVVELNNRLQQATLDEGQEIERILTELTAAIAVHVEALRVNLDLLAQIDLVFAKARYSQAIKGTLPKLNNSGYINLKQARHPLIPADAVVANDLILGKEHDAIVITGPNTGGKTVTLKMVGLITLIAQSGIQIPALDGGELSVFKKLFADIGDEQSIEQNLSTFSSHMTNIVNIMKEVDEETLVLFDELGAGTDPEEGAALAISILDECLVRKAKIIATTHYPELKAYGFNREKVLNASVEFDVETLSPTYRLLLGVPGRSNAFEISKRLGLADQLIQNAKSHVGVDSKNVENMIASLEEAKRLAEKDYEEAKENLKASEVLREELKKDLTKISEDKDSIYQKAEEKAAKALKKAREEAEFIVDEMRQMKQKSTFKEHEWIDAKRVLEEAQPDLQRKNKKVDQDRSQKVKQELKVNDEIRHLGLNQDGVILDKLSEDEYFVQLGMIKLKVKANELEKIKQTEELEPVTRISRTGSSVKTELDLRGERYADALLKLDDYLDSAVLANHSAVSIIHGKGTGALRKAVTDRLKGHPQVKTYRLGNQNEGGSGVTVAELN